MIHIKREVNRKMDEERRESEELAGVSVGAQAIKYGAWIVMLLAVLYFLANYIIPLFH